MERNSEQRIDIYCMIMDVLKDIWVAIFVGISAAFLIYMAAYMTYRPTYTSRSTFVVSVKGSTNGSYASASKAEKLTSTFQSVMNSNVLKKKTAENLGLKSFPGTVDIQVVPETNLLTLSVTADSPELALRLLKNLMETYPEIGEKVLGQVVMEVFEEPGYPSLPNQAFQGRDILKKAFLIGFAAVIGLLALLSYLKDTMKNERDITEKSDMKVFAVLNHERPYRKMFDRIRKKKKKLLITEPSVSFGYREAIRRVRTKLLYEMRKKQIQVVLVTSAAKGEGKTTFAMNLAQVMAENGKKVLLIEGNLRESALAERLELKADKLPSYGSYLNKEMDMREAIITSDRYDFCFMQNSKPVPRGTELLASKAMIAFIEQMREEMDLIIIDAPHAMKRADTEVLARLADSSFVVVKQNTIQSKYINDTTDMLDNYGNGVIGCIFNDVMAGKEFFSSGYGYGYGYGTYGKYGKYGKYGRYGKYGSYGLSEEKRE